MIAVLTICLVLIGHAAVAAPLDRRGVTSAMVFVTGGFLLGARSLGLIDASLQSTLAERVTELALVFLLFSDSMRLDLGSLRRQLSWPSRLLLIGLPLTILLGLGGGLLVFPGMAVASAFLLSTMLCSTDAALGQRVVDDPSVPARVRQALDVESGLNDGLAVPFFLVALDISLATLTTSVPAAVLTNAAAQIGWGVAAGVSAGVVGGFIRRWSGSHRWMPDEWRQVFTFAVAFGAYAIAGAFGGSGFIAAFVAGLAFGAVSREHGLAATYLTEQIGSLLAAVTWMGFGALAISAAWPAVTWRVAAYALISLTIVRMLPVVIAMSGTGARWQTLSFMGWFGPRGLASVVFGLLALERGVPDADTLLATVVVTVGVSVFVHGLTSVPLIARYHRWYSGQAGAAEARPSHVPRGRNKPTGRVDPGSVADAPEAAS